MNTYIYFLDNNSITSKIGEVNEQNCVNDVVSAYINDKFGATLIFTTEPKSTIQKACDGYYMFKNNSIYVKKTDTTRGYIWNSNTTTFTKLGKILLITDIPHKQIADIPHKQEIKYVQQPEDKANKQIPIDYQKLINQHMDKPKNKYNYILQKRKLNKCRLAYKRNY